MKTFIVSVRTARESKRFKSVRVKQWVVVAATPEEAINKVRIEDPTHQAAKHEAEEASDVVSMGSYYSTPREGE